MSYPQLGYPYSSAPQFLMATNSLTACCDSSGRTLAESAVVAASPQTPVYCPVYESRFLATARHDLNPAATLGVYGSPYASGQCYGNYVTCGTDASAFYSLSTFDTKDGTSATAGLSQASAYYPYDPALGQYQYDRYGAMDGSARRKNATRETTSTLKAWLQEHRKNPYPTKGEKIMLAIITKMTLTQVSTWFANARRRLKKENKMTWPPRTKNSDEKGFDDDDEKSQDEPIKSENKEDENRIQKDKNLQLSDLEDFESIESESIECELKHQFHVDPHMRMTGCRSDRLKGTAVAVPLDEDEELTKGCLRRAPGGCQPGGEEQLMLPEKPKIWSLAQTAASLNEAEYSSCMHKCLEMVPSSPGFSRPASDTDRQQDSPVATLRNWIDGVFHEPLFRHRSLNQALANTTVSWASPKSATQETGMLGPSIGNNSIKEHITSLQHHDSHKDRMVFPKTGDKVFCSE